MCLDIRFNPLAATIGVAHWAGRSKDPILQRWGVGALAHLVASSKVVLIITQGSAHDHKTACSCLVGM